MPGLLCLIKELIGKKDTQPESQLCVSQRIWPLSLMPGGHPKFTGLPVRGIERAKEWATSRGNPAGCSSLMGTTGIPDSYENLQGRKGWRGLQHLGNECCPVSDSLGYEICRVEVHPCNRGIQSHCHVLGGGSKAHSDGSDNHCLCSVSDASVSMYWRASESTLWTLSSAVTFRNLCSQTQAF